MAALQVAVGRGTWDVPVRPDDLIPLARQTASPLLDVRGAMQEALAHPMRFEAFRRALTPDDRIVLVVDEALPQLPMLVAGVLDYLVQAGIGPANVTMLGMANAVQLWINDLPDAFADVQTEVHNPADRQKLSYLAATPDGRRIYLNRTLVDADQAIILSGRSYDPLTGYAGGTTCVYPGLADADSQRSLIAKLAPQRLPQDAYPVAQEALDTCWLLGAPFLIQVFEGPGDTVQGIIAGFADSDADGITALNAAWQSRVAVRPDIVVATLSGDPERHDFAALARAAACAAHIVQPQGTIVVLSEADPELGEAINVLRRCDEPLDAVKAIFQVKPPDALAATQWAWAAGQASLYLASEIRPDIVEEIFAVPLNSPRDLQQLLAAPGKCLLIPDAHKSSVLPPA
jgi:nickel-dependent lactate racemase